MRLVSFTVTKYRSIAKAHKIKLAQQTVLVGPNNEGKSNLLLALVAAMRVLMGARQHVVHKHMKVLTAYYPHGVFSWERDFPKQLQERYPNGESEVTLEFALTEKEIAEFKKATAGSNLNGTLPLRVAFRRDGTAGIVVVKKGPGGKALTAKSPRIARFVSERATLEYIGAHRTARSAQEIVSELVERELSALERDPQYTKALNQVASLQQPILDSLSKRIMDTLVQFLPDVRSVSVRIPAEARYRALRSLCEMEVDDGAATLLKHKGDGVQSLAALGIMRHASEAQVSEQTLIIAIEEPESHLHPGAIHELRGVLKELSSKHQLVLTTHNPLFVDRRNLGANIIVRDRKARPATSVRELRESLGVRAADNLQHAELVLLVEGESDRTALHELLRLRSGTCRRALDDNRLAIDTLNGATNLAYKVGLVRSALCMAHCFLDDDFAGHTAFDRARTEGLLGDADVNWTKCPGRTEAEFEDLLDPAFYAAMLQNAFGVQVCVPKLKSRSRWSVRLKTCFERQGKHWDDRVEVDVKRRLADLVASQPESALLASHIGVIDGLAAALEHRLDSSTT